jgi:hypothetical protein
LGCRLVVVFYASNSVLDLAGPTYLRAPTPSLI